MSDAPDRSPSTSEPNLLALASGGGPLLLSQIALRRWPRAQQAVATGLAAYSVGRSGYRWLQARRERAHVREMYGITVPEDDHLFEPARRWLLDHLAVVDTRSLVARTERTLSPLRDSRDFDEVRHVEMHTRFEYDGERSTTVRVGDFEVEVSIGTEAPPPAAGGHTSLTAGMHAATGDRENTASYGTSYYRARKRITFSCPSEEAREAVKRLLVGLWDEVNLVEKPQPTFHVVDSNFGGFRRKRGVRPRSTESVVLAGTLMEDLVGDLQDFLDREEVYERWGMPWHRGYLLYGPPGTGKTSVATALAWRFNLNVYYLTLSSLKNDEELNTCLAEVQPRSLLVLEDLAALAASHERAADPTAPPGTSGVTLQGLLNALDGLMTPYGMVTLMTTNYRSRLDAALVRSGRVDREFHIDALDDAQLRRLCLQFIEHVPADLPSVGGHGVTSADVLGVLKRHFLDYPAGGAALREYLAARITGQPTSAPVG